MDNRVAGLTTGSSRLAKHPANSPRASAKDTPPDDSTLAERLSFQKTLLLEASGVVVEHLSEGLVILDSGSQHVYFNPAAMSLYGFATPNEALLSMPDLPKLFELTTLEGSVIAPEDWPLQRILRGEAICDLELRIRRFSPAFTRIFRYSGAPVICAGRKMAFLTINDVTARKKAERELERVNRLNIARSHVNQAIARTRDRKTLFRQVCEVLVKRGGFGMAWLGWRSARTEQLVPIAACTDEGQHITGLDVYADDRPQGRGPSGMAFRSGKPYICNDAFDDPATTPWRPEFQRRGLLGSAAFPIRRAGRVRGVLSVYAKEVGFFQDEEIALLQEVAEDLSFALDHFHSEAVRRHAQAVAEREQAFSYAMIESTPGVLYLGDEHGRFLRWNRNFVTVTGYSDAEIARMHPLDFFIGTDRERVARAIRMVFEQGESSVEADFIAKDGSAKAYFFTGRRVDFRGLPCLIGMGIDITVRKDAEAAKDRYARRLQATSHRLLTVQEDERRTLARELHDAVGQELTALSLNLTIIGGALPSTTPEKVRERLEDSQELLENTTRHLRDIMVELRPAGLDELGLVAALQEHATQVSRRAELAVTVVGVEPQPRLPPTEEIALFRIAQEALNNVVKHSQASECTISLSQNEHAVILSIVDNGTGFDTGRKSAAGGYGMGTTTMRERAETIGAQLTLEANPGEGTRITIELSWPTP
jgi:PAS domain S-box-containing protein